jgi:hypothetical protein
MGNMLFIPFSNNETVNLERIGFDDQMGSEYSDLKTH